MNKTFNARLDLHERSKGNDAYYLTFDFRTYRIFLHCNYKRMGLKLLISERNSALFSVYAKNQEIVSFTDLKNFVNGFNMIPTKVNDMRKAIESIYADKCAERSDTLYCTGNDNIGFNVFPENFFSLFSLCNKNILCDAIILCLSSSISKTVRRNFFLTKDLRSFGNPLSKM